MDAEIPQSTQQIDTPSPTWDNPIPATPPTEEASAPADTPESIATPPETPDATPTPAELEVQPAIEPESARESQPEAPKDDYVAEADDPPEIAALTTPAAKRWAKRQFKEAEPARLYLDPQKPIAAFGDDLYKRSESRYWEHVDDLVAAHPDYIAQKLAAAKSGDTPATPSAPATSPETPSTSTALTEAELANLTDAQIVQRFNEVQASTAQQVRESLQKEFDARFNELKSQFDAVTGKFNNHEQQAREQQIIALESELKTNVMKAVQEVVRESGLEPKADDPPKIANLKRAAVQIFNTQFEPTFDADEDNVKVVERVREFAKRLERANVFREEDNLRVRAVAAAEKVKQLPEMKAIMDEIMAYVEQSKAKPRAENPAPPVPGAAAGVVVTPPTGWDEAIAQAKVAEASA